MINRFGIVICNYCGESIKRSPSKVKNKENHFCDRICMQLYFTGSNNPNYNNEWSEEQKKNQSKIIKESMNNKVVRYKCGTANRGVKFSKQRVENMVKNRTKESYLQSHTEESKLKIGIKSKEKFTDDYKAKFREKMEENGVWIPLNEKSDYEIYYEESNWKEKMFDRANELETELLLKYKVFNPKTNTKGMVRDHIFSRKTGFDMGVFPEIMRHPCNCGIILNTENISKCHNKNKKSDGITLEELFNNISEYKLQWKEHDLCMELINKYKNGERWKRNE
ncbi:MAG: NUMOD3 domain-containing DNA-binding protein [Candidatus Pacebacteria bacterium]|nr:NUMOD3 domain-containing DNA-binding protein [Candidatus Paceibacterota bacterium]